VDYGRDLEFGLFLDPSAAAIADARRLATIADESGLDLIGIQDHPYQRRHLDTWMLMADVLARTERVRVFPDVANLPLRGAAMIAKQAASLDVMSGGRFEVGLGAGGFWDAIEAMGGPARTRGDAFRALEEAITILRLFWSGGSSIRFDGDHYSVAGAKPGPPPVHTIEIWLGVSGPQSLSLTGRAADGWIPSVGNVQPDRIPEMAERIDAAAAEAGRDPAAIKRLYNVSGSITEGEVDQLLLGPVGHWVETLTGFALDLGFDTFIFWPCREPEVQVRRFVEEVVPAVRSGVARSRER
jgi:alkanesulfonate monooxygenase SsuD/methylene tetrahydromethanopterin reductase-like flavin-dependent oxidoreductase (luciferase family)